MPSLAETQAEQRRARGRVMAIAAIIQTGQPDSLVLLPLSSAGETRAVGERWPARVVWASDTRAARWLTCCRAAVFCADGVEDVTRQRAELAAIFALGTPQLPTGRVLQGPPWCRSDHQHSSNSTRTRTMTDFSCRAWARCRACAAL